MLKLELVTNFDSHNQTNLNQASTFSRMKFLFSNFFYADFLPVQAEGVYSPGSGQGGGYPIECETN